MSYTLSTGARNAAVNAITALINSGSAQATGALQMRTASLLVASLALKLPAFGTASSGSAALDVSTTISGTVIPTSATIDRFRIVDRDVATVFDGAAGSVATSGADINLSSTAVVQNDVVEITGLTCSVPATGGV